MSCPSLNPISNPASPPPSSLSPLYGLESTGLFTSQLSHILSSLSMCSSPSFLTHSFQMLLSSTSLGVLEKLQQPLFLPPLCLWNSWGPAATQSRALGPWAQPPTMGSVQPAECRRQHQWKCWRTWAWCWGVTVVDTASICKWSCGPGVGFLAMTLRARFAQDP